MELLGERILSNSVKQFIPNPSTIDIKRAFEIYTLSQEIRFKFMVLPNNEYLKKKEVEKKVDIV